MNCLIVIFLKDLFPFYIKKFFPLGEFSISNFETYISNFGMYVLGFGTYIPNLEMENIGWERNIFFVVEENNSLGFKLPVSYLLQTGNTHSSRMVIGLMAISGEVLPVFLTRVNLYEF